MNFKFKLKLIVKWLNAAENCNWLVSLPKIINASNDFLTFWSRINFWRDKTRNWKNSRQRQNFHASYVKFGEKKTRIQVDSSTRVTFSAFQLFRKRARSGVFTNSNLSDESRSCVTIISVQSARKIKKKSISFLERKKRRRRRRLENGGRTERNCSLRQKMFDEFERGRINVNVWPLRDKGYWLIHCDDDDEGIEEKKWQESIRTFRTLVTFARIIGRKKPKESKLINK